eukprot:CAMPEP_0174706350 /NCGR_PEP_ID=MMETSP1094-20130205/9233_1 /TAXON_ID=156173 /ORGANISM="Chrysochromulina brevifilum, Strain UTEX LB 985" /LENGTH=35 /DNA_ID= /DNA_START= /DNA_END= /DNA_ORIENTATION=
MSIHMYHMISISHVQESMDMGMEWGHVALDISMRK